MSTFSILKIAASFTPLLIVLYLMCSKFKSTHYSLLNFDSNEMIEVVTDRKMAFSNLMNNGSVILDNHDLCRKITRRVSKEGYLAHIYFDNVNGVNLLILTIFVEEVTDLKHFASAKW